MSTRTYLIPVFLCFFAWAQSGNAQSQPHSKPENWFLKPEIAFSHWKNGAQILDARDRSSFDRGHLDGAISVPWEESSEPNLPAKGNLRSPQELETYFQQKGIHSDKILLVVGDPITGWGEEGRIAWTLRTLGHSKTFIVDGGYSALLSLGIPLTKNSPKPRPGNFVLKRDSTWEIGQKELKSMLNQENLVLLDTREKREYLGETPYGESRGGHLPRAKHIHFKDLIAKDGKLLEGKALEQKLASLGISKDKSKIVPYCTGGIRSAFVTAALVSNGYQAKNYAGSAWEWASLPPNEYPLVKD